MKKLGNWMTGKILSKKVLVSLVILAVYFLGKQIPLPFLGYDLTSKLDSSTLPMSIASSVTGGNMSKMVLFSLGLGPMMSSMIIWRLLTMIKKLNLDRLGKKESDFYQNLISLFIALVEGYGLTMTVSTKILPMTFRLTVLTLIVAGAFVLIWLANMNSQYGIGGPTLVVFFGIITGISGQIASVFPSVWQDVHHKALFVGVVVLAIIIATLIITATERVEQRIPIHRLLVSNAFSKQTYLPIKLNPGGAMAIMYGFSIMMVPGYIIQIFYHHYPTNAVWSWLQDNFNLNSMIGVVVYIIILFFLSFAFGSINMDAEKITEDLRNGGDYITGVRPGRDTQRYLQKRIRRLSLFGSTVVSLLSGLPFFYGVIHPDRMPLCLLPGFFMMGVGMIFMVSDQVRAIRILTRYKKLL